MKKKDKNNKENIDSKYNLSIYWSFLKKQKKFFISVLIIAVILEALNLVNSFLFKIIVDRGTDFSKEMISKVQFVDILLIVFLIWLISIVLKLVFTWLKIHLNNRLENNLITDLKEKFFNHLIKLSHSFHTSNKTGSLISKLLRGGGAMERMTDVVIFGIAPMVFSFIAVTSSILVFSWKPVVVIIGIVASFITYNLIFQKKQKEYQGLANNAEDREKANVADIFTNVDSIKYFGKENSIIKKFSILAHNTKNAYLKAWDFWRWIDTGQTIILGVGTFLLIYFPLMDFLAGELTLGTVVFIYTVYGNLFWPLFSFVNGIRGYHRSMADFNALFKYGKVEQEVKDKPNAKKIPIKEGKIEFQNVGFKYGKRCIFKNLNLKIEKGKKIAFVGHSGCGKTTLVKLLYRLYDVDEGKILIDNKDIREFKQEFLRGEMSIVPQEAILFDETIYNNIAFSKPGASKKEIMAAIKFAQLDKIIRDFPQKEKTIVGERGVKLSGGEKQRVSIARAILANKKVLVLDEATSALDSETEHEIQKDLAKLMQNRTSIIIAHRLSTIMHADLIVVMKKGKIIQLGTHRDLITEGGEYQRLWDLQKGGYIK
ncbi:MAG: ABC transporter ATP-binding protein/permease [Nanoarchaeota archaeon]|nr:ABC transporter ATP-binding protein/permease [Nanoarchaeota archaeon]